MSNIIGNIVVLVLILTAAAVSFAVIVASVNGVDVPWTDVVAGPAIAANAWFLQDILNND